MLIWCYFIMWTFSKLHSPFSHWPTFKFSHFLFNIKNSTIMNSWTILVLNLYELPWTAIPIRNVGTGTEKSNHSMDYFYGHIWKWESHPNKEKRWSWFFMLNKLPNSYHPSGPARLVMSHSSHLATTDYTVFTLEGLLPGSVGQTQQRQSQA